MARNNVKSYLNDILLGVIIAFIVQMSYEAYLSYLKNDYNDSWTALRAGLIILALIIIAILIILLISKIKKHPQVAGNQEENKNEKAIEEAGEKNILGLIRLVDKNKYELFKYFDVFRGDWGIVLTSLVVTAVSIFFLVFVLGVVLKILPFTDQLVLTLYPFTLFFAFFSLTAQIGEKHTLDIRFNRALGLRKKFTEDEKTILKVLVKMRSRNPEIDLERIYNMHPEMFTQEKLLEKLYADKIFG